MDAASGIAAQVAQTRQNVALSAVKSNANAAQAVADILQESASSVPSSSVRGVNVDLRA